MSLRQVEVLENIHGEKKPYTTIMHGSSTLLLRKMRRCIILVVYITLDIFLSMFIMLIFMNRWMRGIRNVQRNTAKIEREFEIRSDLARWDDEFPYMNHEMIVRYAAGMLASSLAVTVYTTLRYPGRRRRY